MRDMDSLRERFVEDIDRKFELESARLADTVGDRRVATSVLKEFLVAQHMKELAENVRDAVRRGKSWSEAYDVVATEVRYQMVEGYRWYDLRSTEPLDVAVCAMNREAARRFLKGWLA